VINDAARIGILEIDAHREPVFASDELPGIGLVDRGIHHYLPSNARGSPG
jgi:hypothetical protein